MRKSVPGYRVAKLSFKILLAENYLL